MIRKICSEVRRVIYVRWRLIGSEAVWFWLARIISGRSQHVNTKRGVDKGSRAIMWFRAVHPDSVVLLSQDRLRTAINRLLARVVGQSHFDGASQVVGTSIIVGIRIFSIVGGLSFVDGLCRVFERLQLVGLSRRLLHRQRMLEGVRGREKNL